MRYILNFCFLFAGLSLFSQAQQPALLTVTGEAVVKVIPDQVILGIRIKKQLGGSDNKPAFEIFKEEDTKIRLFDFNEADLSKTFIQLDSAAYYKEVFIVINDLKKLDKYLLELYNLGYKDYIYMEYRSSSYARYKSQAREEAISDARKKAKQLSAGLYLGLGKAYAVEDLNSESYNWYDLKDKKQAGRLTYRMGSDNYLIEPGYITVTAKLRVSFSVQ